MKIKQIFIAIWSIFKQIYNYDKLIYICLIGSIISFILLVYTEKSDTPPLQEPQAQQINTEQQAKNIDPNKQESPKKIEKNDFSWYLNYEKLIKNIFLAFMPVLILGFFKFPNLRFVFISLISLLLIFHYVPALLYHNYDEFQGSQIGEKTSVMSYIFGVVLIFFMLTTIPFVYLYYARGTIIDKYLIRQFCIPFVFCLLALAILWIIIDLQDNGHDFIDSGTPINEIVQFYIVQIPWLAIEFTPITLLLSLLFCLGKMSKANEIVSMITAGQSLLRILQPIIIVGFYCSFVCLVLNYQLAPWAKGNKNTVHEKITSDNNEKKTTRYYDKHRIFHQANSNRFWYINRIPVDLENDYLKDVAIISNNKEGQVTREIYANRVKWIKYEGQQRWIVRDVRIVDYEKVEEFDKILNKKITFLKPVVFDYHGQLMFPDTRDNSLYYNNEIWTETPWELFSGGIDPEFLGVPKLTSYIRTKVATDNSRRLSAFKTHRHYRFSLPWRCFIVVLLAAPLGIVYSRRGFVGNVTMAVMLYIFMFFLSDVAVAMGGGGRLPAFASAWLINIIFFFLGLYLLFLKDRNKEIPNLFAIFSLDKWKMLLLKKS